MSSETPSEKEEKGGPQGQKRLKRFEGKVTLITGAAGALGSTTARLFSQEGARLVLCDLPNAEPKLKQLVTELGSPAVIYICGDVTNAEDVKKSVQHCVDEFGGIDILFNNAGICPVAPLQVTDDAMFKRVQDVNVYGVFLMMKYVSNKMIELGKEGVIVNTSSLAALKSSEILFAYSTSKFAVSGMTRAAAKSLAKNNIRVCAIAPHALEGSKMADDTVEGIAELMMRPDSNQDKEKVKAGILASGAQATPLGRLCQLQEAAEVVLFLCSKEASYITGVVFPVDGGDSA